MKNLLSLLALSLACMTANADSIDKENYIQKWGKLQIVKNQLSAQNGDPIQLKGWSTIQLGPKESNSCVGVDQFNLMKYYGANVVRLAMPIENGYLQSKESYTQMIKDYIDDAYVAGIYVIVDWHSFDDKGVGGDPNDYKDESKAFFSTISEYCASKEYNHVLYEICNEPKCDGWETIKEYAEHVIPAIVENQPDAMIVVGTNNWCQDILEPIANPISKYKSNVLYSFHYYSCSHYLLLGNFRSAQEPIPVFVSEWSAFKFAGTGPFCKMNADELIYACGTDDTKQLVSWCVWNWSNAKDDQTAFFKGSCDKDNISEEKAGDSNLLYGQYVSQLIKGMCLGCDDHRRKPQTGPYYEPNRIPTNNKTWWRWDAYDYGGEGVAYHDENSSAWLKDTTGAVIGYRNDGEEVDVFSLAHEMQWLDKDCPWSTVEDGKVVAFDTTINTQWIDIDDGNKKTYKSLNGGRYYWGTAGSRRPDEGVDLYGASCYGTDAENLAYSSLGLVEEGEWINFTVDVRKPGYYKIRGIISSEYLASKVDGEIAIVCDKGNMLRSSRDLSDNTLVKSFGFHKTTECADERGTVTEPWNCWAESEAISGSEKEVFIAFPKSGMNSIQIEFVGDASGVGPLMFDFYQEFQDPITCCGGGDDDFGGQGDQGSVDDVTTASFSITPNPTSGEFTITLAENVEATVEIVNMAGQTVASQVIEGTATIKKALAAGVYTVVVKSNGAVSTQKLVVK